MISIDANAIVDQAIADFDNIEEAIEEKGVEVPYDTDTKQYGKLIRGIPASEGGDGFSPIAIVTQTDEGAVISITDVNGTTKATVFNGNDGKDGIDGVNGIDGKDGENGYTPVRGTDYWTETDIAEIKAYVDEAILGGEW